MFEAAAALGLEALIGYPPALQRRIGHPVQWIGAVIGRLDEAFNHEGDPPLRRQAMGVLALAAIAGLGGGFGWLLEYACGRSKRSWVWRSVLAAPALAQRSLHDHVDAVVKPLEAGELLRARSAVARIVGRDVHVLGTGDVVRAALESLAESFNDGVVAPAFWYAVAGLPALYAYKAINTADSMIGHLEPRWRRFGWASARMDDLVNLIPARIAGLLLTLAAGGGARAMVREAPRHASPNAGWPEAAMAGALKVKLGGPAVYDGCVVQRPVFSADAPDPRAQDLRRGLRLYRRACCLLAVGLLAVACVRRRR